MTRSQARESAFIIAFERCFLPDEPFEEIIDKGREYGELKMDDYTVSVLDYLEQNTDNINKAIEDNLKNWKLDRISAVCLSILQVAIAEMQGDLTPVGVAINEAVELAKKYGADDDYSFVNGILGVIAKGADSLDSEG